MNPNRTAGKPIRMSLYSLTRVGGRGGGGKGGGMWRGKLLFQRMTLFVGNVSFTPFEEINSPTSYDFSTAIENISLCYHIMMLRFPNLTTSISCPIQNDNTFLIKYSISILQDMSWINYDSELKEGIASRSLMRLIGVLNFLSNTEWQHFFFDQVLLSYNHSISILQDVSWMNYDTKVRGDRFSLSYETCNSHH